MLVSDSIGTKTRFRSLEVTSTGNPAHSYSRRAGAARSIQPKPRLWRSIPASLGLSSKTRMPPILHRTPQVMARQSVLSAVKDQRDDMMKTLGASDKARLDEYFSSLRQIEQQLDLELQKPAPLEACSVPGKLEEVVPGTEITEVTTNHRLFAGLLAHALACGQTRVINVTFSDATSSLRRTGSSMTHHVFSHEETVDAQLGYQPNVTWFASQAGHGMADMLTAPG